MPVKAERIYISIHLSRRIKAVNEIIMLISNVHLFQWLLGMIRKIS